MKRPIPLSQLVEKIQSQTLTPSEAANVFLVEPNREQPFDFHTYINPEAVDVRNFEALARDADLLVRSVVSDGNGRKGGLPKSASARARTSSLRAIPGSGFRIFRGCQKPASITCSLRLPDNEPGAMG